MAKRSILTRERLDGTAVDIEFLLIAVVQGFALATLAVDAEPVITGGEWVYWPYVVAAFILILNFWALAIMHSISFISWPFDLEHTVLYLLVAFVEVSAFSQITHPGNWFVFMLAFFLVSALLYVWDMKMINDRKSSFADTPARSALYAHIRAWQMGELRYVLPGAIVFEAVVVLALWLKPELVFEQNRHLWIVGAQNLFGLVYLGAVLRGFAIRRRLITACIEDESVTPSVEREHGKVSDAALVPPFHRDD